MPRKKEKQPADYLCLHALKNALWEKIYREWPDKWQPVFNVAFSNLHEISYNRFIKMLHQDIAATLKAKRQEEQATKSIFSEKTLKRILDKENKRGQQLHTKDCVAMYLGYNDYAHFCKIQPNKHVQRKKPHKKQILWIIPVILLVITGIGRTFFQWNTKPEGHFVAYVIKDSSYLPATIQIAYKIPNKQSYELHVSQGHYLTDTFRLTQKSGIVPVEQWRPAVMQIKLINNRSLQQDTFITIESRGWSSWYTSNGNRQPLAAKSVYMQDGFLWYSPDSVLKKHRKDYWTKFIYIQPFKQTADSMSATFRVKNSENTGGLFCFDTGFALYGNNGRFWTAFQRKGCNYYSRFEAPGKVIDRNSSFDIQKLAADFSFYTNLTLKVRYPHVTLMNNADTVLSIPYSQRAGKLQGFEVFFRGSGMLDEVSIISDSQDSIYYNSF